MNQSYFSEKVRLFNKGHPVHHTDKILTIKFKLRIRNQNFHTEPIKHLNVTKTYANCATPDIKKSSKYTNDFAKKCQRIMQHSNH